MCSGVHACPYSVPDLYLRSAWYELCRLLFYKVQYKVRKMKLVHSLY